MEIRRAAGVAADPDASRDAVHVARRDDARTAAAVRGSGGSDLLARPRATALWGRRLSGSSALGAAAIAELGMMGVLREQLRG
ncbi:MAG: hypothetical protein H0X64_02450 [Gemmatimonadaceae bacterium]|nr:hypothetical protein [Gemmatimonadaceae bacterium]